MESRRTFIVISTTIAVMVGAVLFWVFSAPTIETGAATWVTDKADLASRVELSRVGILTGENYVGHRIRVIRATIKNTSDAALRVVDVRMVFTDYDGKPIQESIERAFENSQKPLLPGTQFRFEVNFENLPKSWNYHIPNIEVVKVAY